VSEPARSGPLQNSRKRQTSDNVNRGKPRAWNEHLARERTCMGNFNTAASA